MKLGDIEIPGDSAARTVLLEAMEPFKNTNVSRLVRPKSENQEDRDWIKENTPAVFAGRVLSSFTHLTAHAVHALVDDGKWADAKKLCENNDRLCAAFGSWVMDPAVVAILNDEKRRYLQWRVEFKGDDFRAAREKIFGDGQPI
ncbi:MAG: hypothetical protein V3W44_05140 [Dehalococcoidales bacterium]